MGTHGLFVRDLGYSGYLEEYLWLLVPNRLRLLRCGRNVGMTKVVAQTVVNASLVFTVNVALCAFNIFIFNCWISGLALGTLDATI